MRRSQFRDRNKETSRISNTTHDTKHERKQTGEHEKMVDVLRNSKVKKRNEKKKEWKKKKLLIHNDHQQRPLLIFNKPMEFVRNMHYLNEAVGIKDRGWIKRVTKSIPTARIANWKHLRLKRNCQCIWKCGGKFKQMDIIYSCTYSPRQVTFVRYFFLCG